MADENGNINCTDCEDCFRCTDCEDCFRCTDCTTCSYCISCSECISCRECIDSYHCYDGFINTSHVSTGYDTVNCKNIYSSYVYLDGGGNIYNYTFSSDGFINISSLSDSITNYYNPVTINNYFREILVEPSVTFSSFVKFIYEFKPSGEMIEDINIDEDGIIQGTYWGQNNKITINITPQFIDLQAFIDNNEIIWENDFSFDYSIAIEDMDESGNIRCSNCSGLMCYECKYCTGNYCINCEECNGSYCINCTYCYKCSDCDSCSYCSNSSSCANCNYLDHCTLCSTCNYLVGCDNCIECGNSIYISNSNNVYDEIGNIYTVNKNYMETDTININPAFKFTEGNVLFTDVNPDTLTINERTGNISGVISQTPTVNLLYNNQEYTYIFDTAVHHLYSINVMNNTMKYI